LHKCAILASSEDVRARLRKLKWGPQNENIPVVTDARDLGAHISSGGRAKLATLKTRVAEKLPMAKRIGSMRLALKSKCMAKKPCRGSKRPLSQRGQ
jgi:hypothetical protein